MDKALKRQFEEFFVSPVWRFLRKMFEERLEAIRDSLEDAGSFEEVLVRQGAAKEIRFLLALPNVILEYGEEECDDGE